MDESLTLPLDTSGILEYCSSSDDEEYDSAFTQEDAVEAYRDWLDQQGKDTIKMISLMAMDTFITRFGLTQVNAAKEASLFIGGKYNEKTIRYWRKDFYTNHGEFSESLQGKHNRPFILDDEDCRWKAAEWVRSNSCIKGKPNMTSNDFKNWVNVELLPNIAIPMNSPSQIQNRTARKWLHELGFRPHSHKKGVFIDGHEREDVREYRELFLRKLEILESTHLPPPLPADGKSIQILGNPEASKRLVLIFHDESIFHANESQSVMWAEEGKVPIRPKSLGRGLMISDFVTEHDGLLKLSDSELEIARHDNITINQEARQILHYGAASEGYWTSEKFLVQVQSAITIAEFKYPKDSNTLVWLFDQSSCHCAYNDDALNVKRMNVKPGGAQPVMRDTCWNGKTQKMVLSDGRPKGMKLVLEERGFDTTKMKAADMALVLGNHHDFKHEKTALEHVIKSKGHYCVYIPKFHCELNPIERVWGKAKQYTRSHCDYSFAGLEKTIHPALNSVSIETIRKYFRKSREYMKAYREGITDGVKVVEALKTYKSHRRVFGQID